MESTNALVVSGLEVRRGALPVLHGVELRLDGPSLAILGRNGAGKTTLCSALIGLLPAGRGSIRFNGVELAGRKPHDIAGQGVSIVPQGRRVFPSLTVDEHLRLMQGRRPGPWTVERVYTVFPRLAERRRNFGNQLSGGEQQMLAIGRALLTNPRLLILDEPSEGLAPKIVDHLLEVLGGLRYDGTSVLIVEQNLRVGTSAAERVAIMSGGQIALVTSSRELWEDDGLQQRYLGVSAH
ncbi:ABC transporter ATP-binding protein [Azospirillum argentinense]|uniref:ABC transporter domain-containing protein n=1 Tax=Azospirillum argentinense TaxID=2970906 RepID=A0A5B0KY05_9PROT|nr:ABC transporter ATP-binding protein [Azospirillum argentinense]KAA1056811.1 Branched-chain amino acid transport ATP-binding protein LivF [Azospirillum argentinense]